MGFRDFEYKHHIPYSFDVSGRLFNFYFNCLMFLLVILLNFIDLWWFIAVAWICQEYCRIFLFWIFWYFEGFGWCKRRYGKIKALVEINRINKTLPPNLDSPLPYNFSNYYYNYSLTYFRNVTLQLVKLYCLKPSTLWRIATFDLTHSSLSQTVKLCLLSFLSFLSFSFFEMYFLTFFHLASILSFKINPGMSFPSNLIHS